MESQRDRDEAKEESNSPQKPMKPKFNGNHQKSEDKYQSYHQANFEIAVSH